MWYFHGATCRIFHNDVRLLLDRERTQCLRLPWGRWLSFLALGIVENLVYRIPGYRFIRRWPLRTADKAERERCGDEDWFHDDDQASPCLLRRNHSVAGKKARPRAIHAWFQAGCQTAPDSRVAGALVWSLSFRKASKFAGLTACPPVASAKVARKTGSGDTSSCSPGGEGTVSSTSGVGG